MNTIEKKVLKIVEEQTDEIVELLSSMVQIKTINPPGEYEELVLFLEKRLRDYGLETEIIEVPEEILEREGIEEAKHNLMASYSGSKGRPELHFNAHLDTVSAECSPNDLDKWTYPPFSGVVKEGRIWGRGACDSKGRLACYISAILALIRSGERFPGTLTISATADEETGLSALTGAGYLAQIGKLKGDYAIVEGMCDEINIANPGSISFEMKTFGDSLHTSQLFKGGVNAIHEMNRILSELLSLQEELKNEESSIPNSGYTIINIGQIQGGFLSGGDPKEAFNAGMTAKECTIKVSVVTIPEQDVKDMEKRIKDRIKNLQCIHPSLAVEIKTRKIIPSAISNKESRLVTTLKEVAYQLFQEDLPVTGLTGRTDLVFFAQSGFDCVNFGPARLFGSNLHLPDENLMISDIKKVSQILALTALRLIQ